MRRQQRKVLKNPGLNKAIIPCAAIVFSVLLLCAPAIDAADPLSGRACPTQVPLDQKSLEDTLRSGSVPIDLFATAHANTPRISLTATLKAILQAVGLEFIPRKPSSDFGGLCRYRAENLALGGADDPRRVVYFGDSITENWKLADPEFFGPSTLNRGIAGQTTAQALLRFRQDVIELHPRTVHILLGTNDIADKIAPLPLEESAGNLKTMVDLARSHNIQVLLYTLPPSRFHRRDDFEARSRIVAFNSWLREYARENQIILSDYYEVLVGPDGFYDPLLSNDGVHPNRAGYSRMRLLVEKTPQ